eukprot:TRINITY_DN28987_c0_g1_i1.p1 TRINITY_DN28987_c0_g1~~TRINITY_DN28987_c0_g1_i1.p1  ORF type:complete len:1181 (-),score=210.46 TRINITY_DN28987_c0_g1_i1:211-3753(-)
MSNAEPSVAARIASAEEYFEKHQIRPLITRLLAHLGKELPENPFQTLEQLLASEAKSRKDGCQRPEDPREADRGMLACNEDSDSSTADEIYYEKHKNQLLEELRAGGCCANGRLEGPGDGGVGLLNQGATCYMNSLLQVLFHTPEFRLAIYDWRYDAKSHGDPARCIPLQLQRLFAQLQLSAVRAISTRGFTDACGFSARDSMEQHDVQELCRVLFDALGRSASVLAKAIQQIYGGKLKHYVRCQDALDGGKVPESLREEQFLDLQVPIQHCQTLEEALRQLVEPEPLDGDNQWFCEEVDAKVDALKGVQFEKIPGILCLQLLRFVFDVKTMRRQKLTEAISIPEELDLGFLVGLEAGLLTFKLTAICLHRGTAHGGHYHAYIRHLDRGAWVDANDSNVHTFGHEKAGALFSPRLPDLMGEADGPLAHSSSDAYFLVYRQSSSSCQAPESAIPESIRSELLTENEQLKVLQKAYSIHKDLIEVKVFAPTAPQAALRQHATRLLGDLAQAEAAADEGLSVTINILKSKPVRTVLCKAVSAFAKGNSRPDAPETSGSELAFVQAVIEQGHQARLCRYQVATGEQKEPLDGETELLPLAKVLESSFINQAALLLEVCKPDEKFGVWNEKLARTIVCRWDENEERLGLGLADVAAFRLAPPAAAGQIQESSIEQEPDSSSNTIGPSQSVNELQDQHGAFCSKQRGLIISPTVGAVRAAAAKRWNILDVALVVLTGHRAGQALVDDAQTLQEINVQSDDVICAEAAPTAGDMLRSVALFERIRNTAHLSFNHPDRPDQVDEFQVSLSAASSLDDLKVAIGVRVGIPANMMHLARSSKAPQFKEETKTLHDVGLARSSSVFVGHGAPCGADECMLRIGIYQAKEKKMQHAFTHAAKGSSSIRSLREVLAPKLANWCEDQGSLDVLTSAQAWKRLRLRDGQAGKQFAILRDDRTLRSALLGFADGREIAVQILDTEEELDLDDLIILLRPWRVQENKLFSPSEYIVKKTSTLAELRDRLTAKFRSMLVQAESSPVPSGGEGNDQDAVQASELRTATEASSRIADYLEIVTVTAGGPPLNIKRCTTLNWAESRLSGTDAEDLTKSLSDFKEIRDGCIFVVRSALNAARGQAQEDSSSSKGNATLEHPASEKPKAKPKAKSPAFSFVGQTRKEKALVIDVAVPEASLEI